MGIIVIADGRLHGDGLLGDLEHLAHLLFGHVHFFRQLLGRGFPALLLQYLPRDAIQLVDGLDHVHRDADRPGLVRDGTGNGLADPPGRIRGELVPAPVFELVHRLHEADIAFLYQVEKQQSAIGVLLRDGNDQAQVGLHHFLFCLAHLCLTDGDLPVDFLDFRNGKQVVAQRFGQSLLYFNYLVPDAGQGLCIGTAGFDLLPGPFGIFFIAGERGDKVLAGHVRRLDAQAHDLAFRAPDQFDRAPDIGGQGRDKFGRQAYPHELFRDVGLDRDRFVMVFPMPFNGRHQFLVQRVKTGNGLAHFLQVQDIIRVGITVVVIVFPGCLLPGLGGQAAVRVFFLDIEPEDDVPEFQLPVLYAEVGFQQHVDGSGI